MYVLSFSSNIHFYTTSGGKGGQDVLKMPRLNVCTICVYIDYMICLAHYCVLYGKSKS